MNVEQITLPRKYHAAVEHWRRHYLKDYDSLLSSWDRYFPQDEPFCLCAKMEPGLPDGRWRPGCATMAGEACLCASATIL